MAFLGAATFHDSEFLRSLRTTLDFAAFPIDGDGQRRYAASNQVGDAVVLYASVMGPLWEKLKHARVH